MALAFASFGTPGGGSGGGVQSVTAADTSAVVGGTATNPTVRTGTLDVIAADHPPAADWSNNSHKITNVANGTAASDAAAFGQIPTTGLGLVKLFDSTLGVAAASIDTGANGIAAGHADLIVLIYVRTDRAATQDNINIRVNADSGADYDLLRLQGASTTASSLAIVAATAFTGQALTVSSASAVAGEFSAAQLFIPSYANTVGFKTANVHASTPDETGANCVVALFAAQWRSTAAISRMAITPVAGTNLVTGSRLAIYGCQ